MFTSDMLSRYYSYNAYEYLFNDEDLVKQGVLGNFSPSDADIIYQDDLVGMKDTGVLKEWIDAN